MAGLGANSVKGTVFKLNVNMDPIDNNHMEDVDWEAKEEIESYDYRSGYPNILEF